LLLRVVFGQVVSRAHVVPEFGHGVAAAAVKERSAGRICFAVAGSVRRSYSSIQQ
jgi:hypothetical protein